MQAAAKAGRTAATSEGRTTAAAGVPARDRRLAALRAQSSPMTAIPVTLAGFRLQPFK